MWQRFATALVFIGTSACGQVNLGTDLVPTDTGPDGPPDGGPQVTDSGDPDSGDSDRSCRPVEVPLTLPAEWPFGNDQETFENVFLTWAREENCTICHDLDENTNGELTPPLIIADDQLEAIDRSREEVWATAAASELRASASPLTGPLWRHDEDHEQHEATWKYSPAQIRFLEAMLHDAWACTLPDLLVTQDAGASCGQPGPTPDAGDVDGGPDAGVTDSGTTGTATITNPCYCEEQPDAGLFNSQYCVP